MNITEKILKDAKEETDDLYNKAAELHSLKQSILESPLAKYLPAKEMSFHDKVVVAITTMNDLINNQ